MTKKAVIVSFYYQAILVNVFAFLLRILQKGLRILQNDTEKIFTYILMLES